MSWKGTLVIPNYHTNISLEQYEASQINTKINEAQKEIGTLRKAKKDAAEPMAKKIELEKEKKKLTEEAAEKEVVLRKTLGTIGNIVHDSVPISDNEVRIEFCGMVSSGSH